MNYHLHHQGQDLGVHSEEVLRQRRDAGELPGEALVWRPGMSQWQPLDEALPRADAPPVIDDSLPTTFAATAGPSQSAPGTAVPSRTQGPAFWITVAVAIVVGFMGMVFLVAGAVATSKVGRKASAADSTTASEGDDEDEDAEAVAARPILVSTNSETFLDFSRRTEDFRRRQYLEAYRRHGDRTAPGFKAGEEFIESWFRTGFGTHTPEDDSGFLAKADLIAGDASVRDPIVLLVTAVRCPEQHERIRRYQRAIDAFSGTEYGPYPRFFAVADLAKMLPAEDSRTEPLLEKAVGLFGEVLGPDGIRPDEQEQLGEVLLHGWGDRLFGRHGERLKDQAAEAGEPFAWLALLLEGEHHIQQAWKARGGGFAGTVTRKGWEGFNEHSELAEKALEAAWELNPERPQAPARMVYVSLGLHGIGRMRLWFDRALEARIDYHDAWTQLRWGLRPRWHGSVDALLTLGRTAVATGRFDTDVPRKLFDCIEDAESEANPAPGRRLLTRANIWDDLEKMYRGYIANRKGTPEERGWRSVFAVVARLSDRMSVAREQLEAVDWNPEPTRLLGWDKDLSLMVPEVAALTGVAGREVARAELERKRGHPEEAAERFAEIAARTDVDGRTRDYARIRARIAASEGRLARGEWIPLLPQSAEDPEWFTARGEIRKSAPGMLEVKSGPTGHLIHSRVPIGTNFAVRGEWESVSSSNGDIQAGIVFGLTDLSRSRFLGFRMKNTRDEDQVASVGYGWGRSQIKGPALVYTGKTNRFELEFRNGLATVKVNDMIVFHDNPVPKLPPFEAGEFRLGIGAFNDSNETVIRYRNVEVRRL
jgi:hypothetical protein